MKRKIFCLGAITIDRKLKSFQTLQLGTSNIVTSSQSFGGVAHNVAKNLTQLTDGIYLQSVVGDDFAGQQIINYLQHSNIATDYIFKLTNVSTAEYSVILNPNGEMLIGLADMEIFNSIPHDLFLQNLKQCSVNDIVFIDTNLSSEIIVSIITYCKLHRITLVIDPVSVAKSKKIPEKLGGVHILKPDRYEAEALTGMVIQNTQDAINAGIQLHKRGVKHCIISLGKEGYVIVNEEIQQFFPVPNIPNIIDVSGAGDAFFAGMIYAYQQGNLIKKACEFGAIAAALTLQSAQTVSDKVTVNNINQFKTFYESKEHANLF